LTSSHRSPVAAATGRRVRFHQRAALHPICGILLHPSSGRTWGNQLSGGSSLAKDSGPGSRGTLSLEVLRASRALDETWEGGISAICCCHCGARRWHRLSVPCGNSVAIGQLCQRLPGIRSESSYEWLLTRYAQRERGRGADQQSGVEAAASPL
jgi:hypothetical protein